MERLTVRSYALAAGLAAFGIALRFSPPVPYDIKTEADLEKLAPTQVGSYKFFGSDESAGSSYRMSPLTYDTLKPFGIVARVFTDGDRSIDAVLIAGNDVNSFHDPRVCFTGQGFQITEERKVDLETKTRGKLPATYAKLKGPRGDSQALFLYRGPFGFVGKTRDLKLSMFRSRLTNNTNVDGVFYRFIPNNDNVSEKDFFAFVSDFIDAADKSSNGYF